MIDTTYETWEKENYELVKIEGTNNYMISDTGHVWSNLKKKFLKEYIRKDGRHSVKFRRELFGETKSREHTTYTLVAKAYIPNPESKPEVNHIDGNLNHNYKDNLEWNTRLENEQHARRTGLKSPEKLNSVRHLAVKASSCSTVIQFVDGTSKEFPTRKDAAKFFGVSDKVFRTQYITGYRKFKNVKSIRVNKKGI